MKWNVTSYIKNEYKNQFYYSLQYIEGQWQIYFRHKLSPIRIKRHYNEFTFEGSYYLFNTTTSSQILTFDMRYRIRCYKIVIRPLFDPPKE